MSRTSPQAAFEHAREAMRRNDLEEVFACLDVSDLKRIASNAVALSLGTRIDEADEELRRICQEHGFPLDDLLRARRRVIDSPGLAATKNQQDAMKHGLAAVRQLGPFLAALERYTRRASGAGSLSSRLFANETLSDVRADGTRARGTRVFAEGSSDEVEFVLRKGEWYIKLLARRRV